MDRDPSDRRFDRLMAYLGLLDDAAPLFRPGTAIPGAGVLLAIPALVASGVIDCAHEVYGSIGPAFFGLRTTIVALVLMALLAASATWAWCLLLSSCGPRHPIYFLSSHQN